MIFYCEGLNELVVIEIGMIDYRPIEPIVTWTIHNWFADIPGEFAKTNSWELVGFL